MTLDRVCLCVALILVFTLAVPGLSRAGGVGFTDDEINDDDGPSYFGFVREVDGPGICRCAK